MSLKQLPNTISGLRIILSISLLFFHPFSIAFICIYLVAGLTDILDGFLARKLKLTSQLGAVMDSCADFIMIAVVLYTIFRYFEWPYWVLNWLALITCIRLLSLVVGGLRYRRLAFLHTVSNKITGFLLFAFPLWYWLLGMNVSVILLCSAAIISAIEELLINMTHSDFNRDVRSLAWRKRDHR